MKEISAMKEQNSSGNTYTPIQKPSEESKFYAVNSIPRLSPPSPTKEKEEEYC